MWSHPRCGWWCVEYSLFSYFDFRLMKFCGYTPAYAVLLEQNCFEKQVVLGDHFINKSKTILTAISHKRMPIMRFSWMFDKPTFIT